MDDRMLEEIKRRHNPPPDDVPRDRMWARIEARRTARKPRWTLWRASLAAAAVLAAGIVIGRAGFVNAPPPQPAAPTAAFARYAAVRLFDRAEVLFTDLQVSDDTEPLPAWAAGMLSQTRLLLDSDLAQDQDTKALLQDLELLLARIAAMSPADVDGIRRDITETDAVDRLRLAAATGV